MEKRKVSGTISANVKTCPMMWKRMNIPATLAGNWHSDIREEQKTAADLYQKWVIMSVKIVVDVLIRKCTSSGNRKICVSKKFIRYRQQSYENILSEEGTLLRMNRSIQVEGAFGVLKSDYKYKRFLTRGKTNVKTEFLFLVIGYDINTAFKNSRWQIERITSSAKKQPEALKST